MRTCTSTLPARELALGHPREAAAAAAEAVAFWSRFDPRNPQGRSRPAVAFARPGAGPEPGPPLTLFSRVSWPVLPADFICPRVPGFFRAGVDCEHLVSARAESVPDGPHSRGRAGRGQLLHGRFERACRHSGLGGTGTEGGSRAGRAQGDWLRAACAARFGWECLAVRPFRPDTPCSLPLRCERSRCP